MSKVLISWIALEKDFHFFDGKKSVNKTGPTYAFHQHYFEGYDKHILLSSSPKEGDSLPFTFLCSALRNDFPDHQLDRRYLNVDDVIDFQEVLGKVEPILAEHIEDEIHIFLSAGTAIMRLAWFILHLNPSYSTRIVHTRDPRFSPDSKPERLYLNISKDHLSTHLTIREAHGKQELQHGKLWKGVWKSESMEKIYEQALRIAQADRGNVLIYGPSGTGKEHMATYIHKNSPRAKQAMITVNCAALGNDLLESRLFGHKKGSFTGVNEDHVGYFEQANGGTIFLDEIGDISTSMQKSLLRVLQNQEIQPIGGKSKKIDVRVVTATNRDLLKACEEETFRWDLYYRLAVVDLELPSLAERGTKEKEFYLKKFMDKFAKQYKRPKVLDLSPEVYQKILEHPFPGNLRELESMVDRFYILCKDKAEVEHLPRNMRRRQTKNSLLLEDVEREHIEYVLKLNKNNLSRTARALGIALNTLKRKLRQYGLKE